MVSFTRLFAALALGGLMASGASSAFAAPGHATANANVRSGPGLGYKVVDTLETGEYVIVIDCLTNWCEIHRVGADGWVYRSLLINPYYSTGPGKGYEFPPPTFNRDSSR